MDPVGQDANLTEHGEPMDRSGPVGPQSTTEQSALLGLMTDGTENTAMCPGGPDRWAQGVGPTSRSVQIRGETPAMARWAVT